MSRREWRSVGMAVAAALAGVLVAALDGLGGCGTAEDFGIGEALIVLFWLVTAVATATFVTIVFRTDLGRSILLWMLVTPITFLAALYAYYVAITLAHGAVC